GRLEENGDPRQPGVLRQERQVRRHRGQRRPGVALGSVTTRPPRSRSPEVPWGGHFAPLARRTRGARAFPQVTEPRRLATQGRPFERRWHRPCSSRVAGKETTM